MDEFDVDQGSGGSLFAHLPAIIWQRRWWIIVPVALLTVVGILAAFLLPTRYTSTATLLVQSASLPQQIAGGAPDDIIDRRIARIREQVLSRPELIELVNRYQLYPNQRARAALSDIVDTMRSNVSITPMSAEMQTQANGSAIIAFTLSYSYSDPQKAQAVAQDLSEQVLQLDASRSTQQADATVQFLTDQGRSLQSQIADQQKQLAAFKAANGQVLSSVGATMFGSGGSYDVQIAALQRENSQLNSQRSLVKTQDARDPLVAQAEAALAAAQAQYSDDHPDVKLAKARLAEARQLAKKNVAIVPMQGVDDQIAFNNKQIASLRAQQATDQSRLSAVAGAQSRAPVLVQEVNQMQLKLDQLNEQYKGVNDRLMQAKAGVKAENEQLGERLSIVDPAVVPDAPSFPRRWMLILGGPAAGIALGLILMLGVELLMRPIRDPAQLASLFGESPLGVIPTVPAAGLAGQRQWYKRFLGRWAEGRKPKQSGATA